MNAQIALNNGSKTILVVDDEEGVREVVSEVISGMGFIVQHAASGEIALDLVTRNPIDLVISDVRMSGMDGVALARKLRARYPELPLALMTAYPCDAVEKALRDKKVDFLLQKPFQMEELEGMVENLTG